MLKQSGSRFGWVGRILSRATIARRKDQFGDRLSRNRAAALSFMMLLPLMLIVFFLFLYRPTSRSVVGNQTRPEDSKSPSGATAPANDGRLVVLIIDSLRRQAIDELMPNLKAFSQQQGVMDMDVHTATANMSLPCIQTLLEGRESPYASAIHDFTGRRSANSSLPRAAAQAGLKVAIIGDFILTGLYGQDASVLIGENSLPQRTPERDLTCDVCAIDKAIEVLSDKNIRVLILHLPGTDHVAHRYKPHHPEYDRHYREVDAKLVEFFRLLDLNKDYLVVTGDHGHNDLGNHVPQSVAIFAGGFFPELFAAIGPIRQLHQIDMLFFMAFAENLPLPVEYEGSYFGLERPLDLIKATSSFQKRLTAFISLQKETLAAAGFDGPNLETAVAAERNQAKAIRPITFRRLLPLLVLYIAWVAVAFHANDDPDAPLWPLAALSVPALLLWFVSRPEIGIGLSVAIALATFLFAVRWGEFNRLCFLTLLALGACLTALEAEKWAPIFRYPIFKLIVVGTALAFVRSKDFRALLIAISAFCLFSLPSGPYRVESGFYIVRGFVIGCAVLLLWVVARRWFPKLKAIEWFTAAVLALSLGALLTQTAVGGFVHNTLLDWLDTSSIGQPASAFLYFVCSAYLIWIVRDPRIRVATIGFLLTLLLYCSWFAKISVALLAVVLIVPVFVASWIACEREIGLARCRWNGSAEANGFILFMALVLALWILLQGFFVQQIDFSFGMRYLSAAAPEDQQFVVLYPLTLLKYGLPLAFIVFVCVAIVGIGRSEQVVGAALIFCNFKLATLLWQSLIGPLRSQQKLYEFAMSDFVFISQITVIVAISYLAALFVTWRPFPAESETQILAVDSST